MFKHILLPTDGSELSKKAINGGPELAKSDRRARHRLCLPEEYPYTPSARSWWKRRRPSKTASRTGRAVPEGSRNGRDSGRHSFDSDMTTFAVPYLGIIDAAERHGCDVILMASHGRRGLSGLLLGSETQKVLTHSEIPVIVYR